MSQVDPNNVSWLARELVGLRRELKRNTGGKPGLHASSIESGAIDEYDGDGVLVGTVGEQFDGTHTTSSLNGPPPPMPTLATVSAVAGVVEFRWNGKFEAGIVSPMDFKHVAGYVVHVGEPVDLADQSGVLTGEMGDSGQVQVDGPGVYDVYLVAWSLSGRFSDYAGPVAVAVPDVADAEALQLEIDAAQAAIDRAEADLAAAKLELNARLGTAETELVAHDDRLSADADRINAAFGQLGDIEAGLGDLEVMQGRQVTYGASPPTGVTPGKSLWVTPSGHTYISQECA